MNIQRLIVVGFLLVVALSTTMAHAQADTLVAKVPFRFTVLEKTLPPGDYLIMTGPHQVRIVDADHRVVAIVLANEVSDGPSGERGQITFHCYGTRCFLWEVWPPVLGNGRRLLISPSEAAAARKQTAQYFAVLADGPTK
jgi:hypothetical protein